MSATISTQGPLAPVRTTLSELRTIFLKHRPELLSAATARLVTIFTLNPLDVAKTRLQTTDATSPLALRAATRAGPPLAGVIAAMLAHAPGGILGFVAYARLRAGMSGMAAAAMADVIAATWMAPLEAAKLKVQAGIAGNMVSSFGSGGVFIGWGSQVVRDVSFRLLHLGMYERVCRWVEEKRGEQVGVVGGGVVGGVVGGVIGGITTPLDVIKTRVMSQRPGAGKSYQGWLACANRTVKMDGFGGLWRGASVRVVYMAASVALFSAAYEVTRKYLREREEDVVGKKVFVDVNRKKLH